MGAVRLSGTRKAMNQLGEDGRRHSNKQAHERSRVPIRLGGIAFGLCLTVNACGASPDAATTGGGEQVARTAQAVTPAGQSLYVLGKCLDVPAWNDTNQTNVQLYDCNGGTNQQWQFWSDGTVRPAFNTNKCLDLPAWQTANNTPIEIYDCNGGSNQRWTLNANGELLGFGNKCVDVPAFQTTNGTNLEYYDCNGGSNQMIMRAPPISGISQFWNLKAEEENSGVDASMCMGIAGGLTGGVVKYGTNVVVWDCNSSPDQRWVRTFQTDPSGQSGKFDLVNGAFAHLSPGDKTYPVCLWGYDVKPVQGEQMKSEYCPDLLGTHEDFVMNFVKSDAYGYPCFTLQNPETGLYVGVANAQNNPVRNGMNVVLWSRTASDDQVWCDHSANTQAFTLTPDYVVTTVIYAPPGKSSSMQYQSTTTVGSSTSSTKSFQNSTDVTASASGTWGVGNASVSVTANHTFGDSDTSQVDLTTTWSKGYKKPGETDGINHDWDEIWFVMKPILNISFTPSIANGPATTNWEFGQGDGVTTDITFFAYAGELNGDLPMDDQLQNLFTANNITPDMYAGILDADPFFQGITPQPGMNSPRFDYIGEFPYQPPATSGGQPSTQTYSVAQSTTTSQTTASSYSNSVGFTVSGGANIGAFKASLSVSSKWTWSHSSSKKDSTGNGSTDTFTVAQPTYGYKGPGLLRVYEDRIFKTYAFTLDYAGNVPFTDDGSTQCVVGGVSMHCCPSGNAMVGVRLDQNVFKCAPLQDASGPIVADYFTYRNVNGVSSDGTLTAYNMHTCPFGSVMVGLRQDMNILACQQIPAYALSDGITGELVDTGTLDNYPMHVCESTPHAYAMSGLDPANNLLTCATNPGLK